ncbi:MAG: LysM peptidoglycan-binding domain-containing protein [Acidimicrobiia bacterium]|nr:LysM peptidoglycan-binding domain-containing protein [Acidimicrobiia bacterium]
MEPVLVVLVSAIALAGAPLAVSGASLVLRTIGGVVALRDPVRFRVWAWLASMTVLVPSVRSMPAAHAQPPALEWTDSVEPPPDELALASPALEDPSVDHHYVVAPGDSLWAIASRHLDARGLPSSDADVNRFWRDIYGANRAVIGCDPDLIHPGQRLVVPEV